VADRVPAPDDARRRLIVQSPVQNDLVDEAAQERFALGITPRLALL
jgi:hypothetical protein